MDTGDTEEEKATAINKINCGDHQNLLQLCANCGLEGENVKEGKDIAHCRQASRAQFSQKKLSSFAPPPSFRR
jgi:hypothetical protein